MRKQRRAPAGGYDFPEKAMYREMVWSRLSKAPFGNALLMPSTEALEPEVAERHGFSMDRQYWVDANPANIAVLSGRYDNVVKVPGAHGQMVSEACQRFAAAGVRFTAANLDFTSCVNSGLVGEVRAVWGSGALAGQSLVSTTLLRGREFGAVARVVRALPQMRDFAARCRAKVVGSYELTDMDVGRIAVVLGSGAVGRGLVAVGVYRSGSQTMMWVVTGPEPRGGSWRKKRARAADATAIYIGMLAWQVGVGDLSVDQALSEIPNDTHADIILGVLAEIEA